MPHLGALSLVTGGEKGVPLRIYSCGQGFRGLVQAGTPSSTSEVSGALGPAPWGGEATRVKIQEWRGLWVSGYLGRPRSDSAPGAAVQSSDKSPRPIREGAAGPGTERPGSRAPPGTEALRPPKPHSCPVRSGLRSSGSNSLPRPDWGGARRPQEDPPRSGPLRLCSAFNHFPAGSPPLTWHPAAAGKSGASRPPPPHAGTCLSPGRFQPRAVPHSAGFKASWEITEYVTLRLSWTQFSFFKKRCNNYWCFMSSLRI